jgi:hypothetical protein
MTELERLEKLLSAAGAATATVQQAWAAIVRTVDGYREELPSNGSILIDPAGVLRSLQDIRTAAGTAVDSMLAVEWPTGAHYQRYVDERKQARAGGRS